MIRYENLLGARLEVQLMLQTVETAFYRCVPVHVIVDEWMSETLMGVRDARAMARGAKSVYIRDAATRRAEHSLRERKRMRGLIKQYASFRGEDPRAKIPAQPWRKMPRAA